MGMFFNLVTTLTPEQVYKLLNLNTVTPEQVYKLFNNNSGQFRLGSKLIFK